MVGRVVEVEKSTTTRVGGEEVNASPKRLPTYIVASYLVSCSTSLNLAPAWRRVRPNAPPAHLWSRPPR
ncbi:hypothetical protein BD626DRAFT_484710 [Schizophyllum amplum]|uniref:Uncharacterized protein n=1 Tax=Schizophyllum amplum TaxID=97359 RepID=A0A550CQL9_9AGAR|nr:hypothetical protein BD626DRAFT_484710 [Auriculariopsis ampla]